MSSALSELRSPAESTSASVPAGRIRSTSGPAGGTRQHPNDTGGTRRTEKSLVRFTPEEFAVVVARARTCGRAPARFIREVALGAVPRERRSAINAELIRQLARIGNNLNQLATRAHSGAPLPGAALDQALSELLAAVRRLEPDGLGSDRERVRIG